MEIGVDMDINNNKEIFERIAKQYDTEERVKVAEIIADEIRTHISDAGEKSAMDYGCGTGVIGLALMDIFQSMMFVDTSPNMITEVQKKIKAARIQTADTLCCDFTLESPPSMQVDYVLLSQVLLHVKDVPLILSRLYGILNKGGHLIIVDFNEESDIVSDKIHNGFVQDELRQMLVEIGFESVSSHTFYHGEKILMNQDASMFMMDGQK